MNCPTSVKKQRGFTLIELLVVIGILAILLSIVLIAINPARQFGQANNTKRRSDTTAILNAIGAYAADNKGNLPSGIPATAATITDGTGGANVCSALMPTYISALPADPAVNNGVAITTCTSYSAGYTVVKDANNRVTVAAPSAENSETISVTR
ncbi:MAG: hypothetical protein A2698_00685 [Candidatus Levybacteria bacterium RIFCSPHIGHO2_01_FULL_42_15]|nr:MAG: hypothetical protein A2698_00685 [Candidatus Levybacteria bacterium RIFCSPHIGHO2_01_FULL_42_15]OGH42767.1 MAG: hypothetical protein A3B53_01480 [Candidatus Levybacteria bacterium RIFCSPLOWO2_01_FULL_42_15]